MTGEKRSWRKDGIMTKKTLLQRGWMFAKGDLQGPGEEWKGVHVPHDWMITNTVSENAVGGRSQGYYGLRGIGWYRLMLPLEKQPECLYFLDFGGIMEHSTVWVNGQEAGGHGWGYTPFRLEVTDQLLSGDNEILIRADCSVLPADRWYSGGGLYRPVSLVCAPKTYLDPWNVVVRSEIREGSAGVEIESGLEIPFRAELALGRAVCAKGEGCGKIQLCVKDPQLWSAENPVLYTLKVSLADGTDELTMRIGLRDVWFTTDGFFVNGKKTYMRGVCVHQDVAAVGNAADKNLWRERLLRLKGIGCNAIRGAHHVHSEAFLDLCDELGFYVYEEFTDKWHSGSYGRYFDSEWQKDAETMIRRDRNRPSVVVWGCGNEVENQAQPSMLETLALLTDFIRGMDPTRPVTYAMNPHFKRRSGIDASKVKDIQKFVDEVDEYEIEDLDERVECISRIAEYVDVISCNYQEQWFEAIHRANPTKPILATEVYQFFIGHVDGMQNFDTHALPVVAGERFPACCGSFIWAGYDYLGESMGWPARGSNGAVFRTNGTERAAAQILKSFWKEEPMVHISILDYSLPLETPKEHWGVPPYAEVWDFPDILHQVLPYLVATNCEQVTLEYGEKKLYLPPRSACPGGYITGFVPYVPGRVTVTGWKDGKAVCSHTLYTPGMPECIVLEAPEETAAEEGKCMMISARVLDAQGHPVIRAKCDVAFEVEGPAELIAVDNGCFQSHVPYQVTHGTLFHGAVSAVIRLTGDKGLVKISAASGEKLKGSVEIHVTE